MKFSDLNLGWPGLNLGCLMHGVDFISYNELEWVLMCRSVLMGGVAVMMHGAVIQMRVFFFLLGCCMSNS